MKTPLVLTPEDKLKILDRAYELLDGGRRWIKRAWWSKRKVGVRGGAVECYCLAGAISTAAKQLGYTQRRFTTTDVATSVSVSDTVKKIHGANMHIPGFNDRDSTTWSDIEEIFSRRRTQLQAQVTRRAKKK